MITRTRLPRFALEAPRDRAPAGPSAAPARRRCAASGRSIRPPSRRTSTTARSETRSARRRTGGGASGPSRCSPATPSAPRTTTATDPRKVLPFALAGMFHVQVAAPPCTRCTLALSRTLPTRPMHVTRPFCTTAPVSERAATSRSVNERPATGRAGVGLRLRTTRVGFVTMSWYV